MAAKLSQSELPTGSSDGAAAAPAAAAASTAAAAKAYPEPTAAAQCPMTTSAPKVGSFAHESVTVVALDVMDGAHPKAVAESGQILSEWAYAGAKALDAQEKTDVDGVTADSGTGVAAAMTAAEGVKVAAGAAAVEDARLRRDALGDRLVRVCASGTVAELCALSLQDVSDWRRPIHTLATRLARLATACAPGVHADWDARVTDVWHMLNVCLSTAGWCFLERTQMERTQTANELMGFACKFGEIDTVRAAIRLGATTFDVAAMIAVSQTPSPERTELVKLMVQCGARNLRDLLNMVTAPSTFNDALFSHLLQRVQPEDLDLACRNAALYRQTHLVRRLQESGKMTHVNANTMLKWACTTDATTDELPFDAKLCDYLIDTCGANSFQDALQAAVWWPGSDTGQRRTAVLEYLHRRAPTGSLDWNSVLRYACRHKRHAHLIPYMFGAGGDLRSSRFCRYPQQRPLILQLVALGVAPEVLAAKIGGMHKFMKNAQHRRVVAAKHLRRRLPPPGLIPVVQLYILD